MSGIERFFAGLLLAGAIGGAAAFAHSVGGGPEKTAVAPLLQPAQHAASSTTVRISALPGVPVPLGTGPAVATIRHALQPAPAAPAVAPAAGTPVRPLAVPRVVVVHTAQATQPAAAPLPKPARTTHVAPEPKPAAPATPTPTPAPTPTPPSPAPAPAPAATPAPAVKAPVLTPATVPTQPSSTGNGNGNGRGKAKGHDKQQNEPAPQLTPVADSVAPEATQVEMAVTPAAPVVQDDNADQGNGNGNGNGNHGRGHGNDK